MGKVESEAVAIYDKLGRGANADVKTIRDALLAAEKRGREEAAKICETHRVYEIGDRHMLAAAIRSGQ